jgi:hypothetical protein
MASSREATAPEDLDATPEHAARVAGPERFHRGLLGGKPGGERGGGVTSAPAIGYFFIREHPPHETFAVAIDGVTDALDLGGVDAGAYNFHSGDRT